MIKFEKIKPGMTLYEVRPTSSRTRLITRGQKWECWPVSVKEVDTERRKVFASWNGNAPRWMREWEVTRYRAKPPKEN